MKVHGLWGRGAIAKHTTTVHLVGVMAISMAIQGHDADGDARAGGDP